MSRLGLIAGGGALPVSVAARCEAEGRPVFLVRLTGFADPHLIRYPGIDAGMAEIGKVLSALKKAGCTAVCFAGTVSRPDFKSLKPDLKGATLLPGIIAAATKGDDALLRKILSVFEAEGYAIEGADDILGGETLPGGALGAVQPTEAQLADLRKALHVAEKAGELDIGQGSVVCDGLVLAVEAQEGTDAMLARVAGLPADLRGSPSARKGVLAKAPKPIQDLRVDMPVIGARTVEMAAAAGLAGVGGVAGKLIVIDRADVIEAADRLGLFVWGETR
ncbi:MAG: UDP-2,3-diacylglucosamine diphosphatase LpxI [Alphaproteobacteria bacterium]|jgi:UDP-2,3-diacylglucosamine hydrolase|nr:UDP-2,3-diacylglucosamine diphosphatase LpxI [Alphaproteobacteria bacterium]MBU2042706.1 UDP-2,3-diacylglucosamine diphosphatase LpxI [Alphaproteobacteria bacterium]MBU2126171.1 UDP-2,3-diacylglucosamine diphosphatase LpxI [Alphaproteobacteria bacterium]MBU2208891.1 UDP-2,3-diacylglucosamine diphosphatase LpxI [Alphaproteobacteria bacterium]MBU2290378.1 UDP-2,3-diacylglucosamine diphosphatase LpxI [Alphaproteobacteria bacterium]